MRSFLTRFVISKETGFGSQTFVEGRGRVGGDKKEKRDWISRAQRLEFTAQIYTIRGKSAKFILPFENPAF